MNAILTEDAGSTGVTDRQFSTTSILAEFWRAIASYILRIDGRFSGALVLWRLRPTLAAAPSLGLVTGLAVLPASDSSSVTTDLPMHRGLARNGGLRYSKRLISQPTDNNRS